MFFDAFDMVTDLPGLRVPPGLSGALRYIAVGVPVLVRYVVHITTLFPHVCLAPAFVCFSRGRSNTFEAWRFDWFLRCRVASLSLDLVARYYSHVSFLEWPLDYNTA